MLRRRVDKPSSCTVATHETSAYYKGQQLSYIPSSIRADFSGRTGANEGIKGKIDILRQLFGAISAPLVSRKFAQVFDCSKQALLLSFVQPGH